MSPQVRLLSCLYDVHVHCIISSSFRHKVPPSTHVSFIHIEYLRKICNEQANSLQGLKYIGGPEHTCACDQWKGVVPCVAYPEEIEIPSNWRCDECLHPFKVDLILNPDVSSTALKCKT